MELQIETMFESDAAGRLLRWRTRDAPAPRVFVGRTRLGLVWRFRADVPPALVAALARLLALESATLEELLPERWAVVRERLRAGAPDEETFQGNAFRFPSRLTVPEGEAELVEVDPSNADCLEDGFPGIRAQLSKRLPCVAVLREGSAVSVACAAAAGHRAIEVGVETLPAHRGERLARHAVARWAGIVRGQGLHPLYSASWENRASLAVARSLELIPYGQDLHLR